VNDEPTHKPRPGMPAWGQSWALETVRERSPSDRRALITLWIVVVLTAALAVWGSSVILGGFSVLALAVASAWTYTRWRNRSEGRAPDR
jgi:hypothetical protein